MDAISVGDRISGDGWAPSAWWASPKRLLAIHPLAVAVYTGLRRGEVCGFFWNDIDLRARTLTVQRAVRITKIGLSFREPKTASGRRLIVLPEALVEELRRHQDEQARSRQLIGGDPRSVCTREEGSLVHPDRLTKAVHTLIRRVGLPPVRLHDLRHTNASLLLQQDVYPKIVQERLGHSSIQVTMDTYSHLLPGLQEKAIKRFDDAIRQAKRGRA